jgi:hypothetical protein
MDDLKLLLEFRNLVSPLLLHVPSAKVRAPCLDQTTIDPWHCDRTTTVAPLPEILTHSDLEYFLSARRIRPLLLLRARLLDFVCTPENTISFELDILEDFTVPRSPCILGIHVKLRSKVNDDRWFIEIVGPQHAYSLPESSTSTIWKVLARF